MAITVRELVTKLTVDGDRATDKLARFGLAVTGITAALDIMVRGFDVAKQLTVGFVRDQAVTADSLDKVATSAGVTTQTFQRMSFIAEQLGIPMTNLVKGTQNLARNMRDAAAAGEGKGSFNLALQEVGLTIDDIIGKDFPEQLGIIGDALNKLEDPAARVAVSQKLLGEEAGPKMLAALAQGSKGVQDLTKEFEELGGATSKATIQAGVDLVGAIDKVGTFISLLKLEVLELAPEITGMVNQFLDWLKANRTLIRSKLIAFFQRTVEAVKKLAKSGTDWIRILEGIVQITIKSLSLFLRFIEAIGGVERAVIATAGILVGLKFALFAMANPMTALITGLGFGAAAFTLFADEALKAQRAQEDFNEVNNALDLSKARVKAIGGAVSKNVFFGGGLSTELLDTLTILNKRSLNAVFSEVGGAVIAQSQIPGFKNSKKRLLARVAAVRAQVNLQRIKDFDVPREAEERRRKGIARFRENQDRLDREAAAKASFDRIRQIGDASRGRADKSQPDVTDAELLTLINQAAQSGQSLTGLIGRRNIPGGVPPVIAMRVFAPVINQQNEVTIEVEGAEDFSAAELREEIIDTLEAREQTSLREALEALQPAEAV